MQRKLLRQQILTRSRMMILGVSILFASAAPRAAPASSACQLLTQAQVSTALGVEVDAGAPVPTVAESCVWRESGKPPGDAALAVQVQILTVQQYERIKMHREVPTTPQDSIGEEAHFYKDPITGFQLLVRAGTTRFLVVSTLPFLRYPPGDATDEKCKAIESAIARAIAHKP
jgi:hypothetical protein